MKKMWPSIALLAIIAILVRFEPHNAVAQGGGFPSYPSFSGVSVNAPTGGATQGNVNITGSYQVNGTALIAAPRISYGSVIQTAAATCQILPLSDGQTNNLASVACSAVGTTTITFTTAYTTNPPLCVASYSTNPGFGDTVFITGFTTTTVSVETAGAAAAIDGLAYNIICMGT